MSPRRAPTTRWSTRRRTSPVSTNVLQFGDFPSADSPVALVAAARQPRLGAFDPTVAQAAGAAGMTATSLKSPIRPMLARSYAALFAADPVAASAVIYVDGAGSYSSALFTIQTQAGEAGAAQLRTDLDDAFAPVEDAGLSAVATRRRSSPMSSSTRCRRRSCPRCCTRSSRY